MKHVGSFIRLQRSNSSIKSKRVFPLFLHKRISTVINNITPANEKQKIKYRSFKNLDVMALNEDMSKVNIQVQSICTVPSF
jgi:hypothetical protein